MFGLEAIDLARIQFALTVSFHIIFPAITIGLSSYLAVLEGLWLKTTEEVYRDLYHFWSKIFAISFVMGVVSELVMAYQFGTNWSHFPTSPGPSPGRCDLQCSLHAFSKPASSVPFCSAGIA